MTTKDINQKQSGKNSPWYTNLSDPKKLLLFSILIPLIISIIVGSMSYLILEQYQTFRDEKNIAQGIKIEFESMEPDLNTHIGQWENFSHYLDPGYVSDINASPGDNIIPLTPIYPDSGL
jgi:hypothetical protein